MRTDRRRARGHLIGSAALVAGSIVAVVGCAAEPEPGSDSIDVDGSTTSAPADATQFPDVVEVDATYDAATDTWSFAVTMSSPYDTPERYADGWRVMTTDGVVLGTHTLLHDHAAEQPFTRTQTGVEIPAEVDTVVIEGRDQENGFGGATATITLDRS